MRLITKYLGPCTQAPHTDVLAKLMDTLTCTPQSFAKYLSDSIINNKKT